MKFPITDHIEKETLASWIICGLAVVAICIVFLFIQLRDRSGDSAHQQRIEAKR